MENSADPDQMASHEGMPYFPEKNDKKDYIHLMIVLFLYKYKPENEILALITYGSSESSEEPT